MALPPLAVMEILPETASVALLVPLARALAESPRAKQCYALHWSRYATGVNFDEEEDALIPIQEAFASDDGIQDLLLTIATSDVFRHLWTGESP